MKELEVSELLGKTFTRVERDGEEIHFYAEGMHYVLLHEQDCCEDVHIESVVGDLSDLEGAPILRAEEAGYTANGDTWGALPEIQAIRLTQRLTPETVPCDESKTWTFYKFATRKGYVDIRWVGESNGYYSERVSFIQQES